VTGKLLSSIGSLGAAALPFVPMVATAQELGHPVPGQIGLQPSVTPIMDSIHAFHDGPLLWTAVLIALLVLVLLIIVIVRFNAKANPKPSTTTHNTLVEIVWTVVPILILVIIAIPSFAVLTDQLTVPDGQRKYLGSNIFSFGSVDVPAPGLTVKATGNQWYWTYEYVDQAKHFDSNILDEKTRLAQTPVQPRLLAVDNMLVVPVNTTVSPDCVSCTALLMRV
jgi:cytochrome c oxidase subunit 2